MNRWLATLVVAALMAGAAVFGVLALTGDDSGDDPNGTASPGEDLRPFMQAACEIPPEWAQRVARGYVQGGPRDNDLIIIPASPGYVGGFESTSHSGPYDFLQ